MTRVDTNAIGKPLLVLLAVLVLIPSACREKKPKATIRPLEGKVEKVEINPDGTGKLTVRFYNDKHKQYQDGQALVTADTRITIDGVAAKLSDIKEGEHIRGNVLIERVGKDHKHTIVDVSIERQRESINPE